MIDVSIVILNWNTSHLLGECIDSIVKTCDGLSYETLVVDNHSSDDSVEMVRTKYPQVHVIANLENLGFARGNNVGVEAACGQYVLLLNSDAMLKQGALKTLLDFACTHPQAGMVGARLLNPDGTFQASYTPIPNLRQEFLILSGLGRLIYGRSYPSRGPDLKAGPQLVGYVEGACMLSPRQVYLDVGGLDEGYFMYAEDVDLCYAMHQAGWQIWYHPGAEVLHIGGASSKNRKPQREADLYRSRVRFFRKYYGPRHAAILKYMIYFFTLVKSIYHRILVWVSGGRAGRPVVSLRYLIATLKEA